MYSFDDEPLHPAAQIGLWMKDNLPEDSLIACGQAGQIPYFSEMACIDLFGLNDPILPKLRKSPGWDYTTYILAREPDYICDYKEMFGVYGEGYGKGIMVDDPRFQEKYALYKIINTNFFDEGVLNGGQIFVIFVADYEQGRSYDFDEYMANFSEENQNVIEIDFERVYPPISLTRNLSPASFVKVLYHPDNFGVFRK